MAGRADLLPGNYGNAPTPAAATSTAFNLGNVGGLDELTKLINSINLAGQKQANVNRIPGEAGLETQSSTNISNELAGKLPSDVLTFLRQQAAERGIGGTNADADYLKSVLLTSLDMTRKGESELSAATARNPGAPLFDPSGMLLSPYQSGQLGIQQGELTLAQQSEADRVALERQRLAQSAALGQGGGGGGYGPRASAATSPWAGTPAEQVLFSPNYGQGSIDSSVPFNWQAATFGPNPTYGYGTGTPSFSYGSASTDTGSTGAPMSLEDWGQQFTGIDPNLYNPGG